MARQQKRRKAGTKWKNLTTWDDHFLRRMLSWVCKEIDYPRLKLTGAEFGNRTNRAYSGRAWYSHRILVRVGPESRFPCNTFVHGDGFSVGKLVDRIEALVKVTAHEVAHLDNERRGNNSRRGSDPWGGSERYTDSMAKQVLIAFRKQRDELVAEWSAKPTRVAKPKISAVEKRANAAFEAEKRWEAKAKRAKTALAKAKKKAAYYRKKYPADMTPA